MGRAAEEVVQQACDGIKVPAQALDPVVVQQLQELCVPSGRSNPAAPNATSPPQPPSARVLTPKSTPTTCPIDCATLCTSTAIKVPLRPGHDACVDNKGVVSHTKSASRRHTIQVALSNGACVVDSSNRHHVLLHPALSPIGLNVIDTSRQQKGKSKKGKKNKKDNKSGLQPKAERLAQFLLHHGLPVDVVEFVVTATTLVFAGSTVSWKYWVPPDAVSDGVVPLWWRLLMLGLQSQQTYYLQVVEQSTVRSQQPYYLEAVGQITPRSPNLDIRTWDTVAVLLLFKMPLFALEVRTAAKAAITNFRDAINHFDLDMSFSEGFNCIAAVLRTLGLTAAAQDLLRYREGVRALFPAYGKADRFRQSREVPLMLIGRQYAPFRKHVLQADGSLPTTCRLHFKTGASSGKTIMATMLAAEFALDALHRNDGSRVLYLTHTPILAHMAADSILARLNQVLPAGKLAVTTKHATANVYSLALDGVTVVVVATINAALDGNLRGGEDGERREQTLQTQINDLRTRLQGIEKKSRPIMELKGKLVAQLKKLQRFGAPFEGAVLVDEAHAVYASDRRPGHSKGDFPGQCRVIAAKVDSIIRWWVRGVNADGGCLILFSDSRNQTTRFRFSASGDDTAKCSFCGLVRKSQQFGKNPVFESSVRGRFRPCAGGCNRVLHNTNRGDRHCSAKHWRKTDTYTTGCYHCIELQRLPRETQARAIKICSDCVNVQKAFECGIVSHCQFLGCVEDPHFPHFPPESVITGGKLDANYRNPVSVVDCALAQFGGQSGDRTLQHIDPEAIEGRAIQYEDVALPTATTTTFDFLAMLPWKDAFWKVVLDTTSAYAHALTKPLLDACECLDPATPAAPYRPDILVLAPHCSDDAEFLSRLRDECLKRLAAMGSAAPVQDLLKTGQLQFGSVEEWTGADCPVVIVTGFHQPHYLLVNKGVYLQKGGVPVDAALYIALTRSTLCVYVVEPQAQSFVEHMKIGLESRQASGAVLVQSSVPGKKAMYLNNEQRVLSNDKREEVTSFDFTGHHLETIPEQVFIRPGIVESLNISQNAFSSISSRLGELVRLQSLDLSGTQRTCV